MGRKRKRSRGWGKGEGEGRKEGRRALEMVKCEKLQLLIVTTLPNLLVTMATRWVSLSSGDDMLPETRRKLAEPVL